MDPSEKLYRIAMLIVVPEQPPAGGAP